MKPYGVSHTTTGCLLEGFHHRCFCNYNYIKAKRFSTDTTITTTSTTITFSEHRFASCRLLLVLWNNCIQYILYVLDLHCFTKHYSKYYYPITYVMAEWKVLRHFKFCWLKYFPQKASFIVIDATISLVEWKCKVVARSIAPVT